MERLIENLRTVLMIEDDFNDEALGLRGLSRSSKSLLVQVARDGQTALNVLGLEGAQSFSIRSLIICDLKLPKRGGAEVLKAVRAVAAFDQVPVVMFSSSGQRSDIEECQRWGASAYVQKPMGAHEYMDTIRAIADSWLDPNETPVKNREFFALASR